MHPEQLKAMFDLQAAGYDAQWVKTAPIKDCLHFVLDTMFAELPADARILSVGSGTGAELAYLAARHPAWHFTAVEPSPRMLEQCRQRAEQGGFAARCDFHEGYLDSLIAGEPYQAAICLLVSHFILDQQARSGFFRQMSARLAPGGMLANADLAYDVQSRGYETLLRAWITMMATAEVPSDAIERMRKAYASDVGVLPPGQVAAIIEAGGFDPPVPFFQAGLIHAWWARRAPARTR